MTDVPDILPYPLIPLLEERKELHSSYVYVVKRYPESGLAVTVFRENDNICIRMGDFQGKVIDPSIPNPSSDLIKEFWRDMMPNLLETLTLMKVEKCIMYISDDDGPRLVDFRLSINKFTGPGYIVDLFSKQMRTQEVVKTIQMNDKIVKDMIAGKNGYEEEYIIKPSRFKFTQEGNDIIPMYGKVLR